MGGSDRDGKEGWLEETGGRPRGELRRVVPGRGKVLSVSLTAAACQPDPEWNPSHAYGLYALPFKL